MDLRKILVLLSLLTIFAGCGTFDTKMKKDYYMGSYEYTRNQPRQIQNLDIVYEHFPSKLLEVDGHFYLRGWSSWQIIFDVANAEKNELDRMKDYISQCRCSNNSIETHEYFSNIQDEPSDVQRNLRVYLEGADAKKFLDRFRGAWGLSLSVLSTQRYIDAFKYPPERPIEVPLQQP